MSIHHNQFVEEIVERYLTIRGQWAARDDSVELVLERLMRTFAFLGAVAPEEWSRWYRSFKSIADRKKGPTFVSHDASLVEDLIRKSPIGGLKRSPDLLLGYLVSMNAGPVRDKPKMREHSVILLQCCSKTGPYAGYDRFNLDFPLAEYGHHLYEETVVVNVLKSLSQIWDPDWMSAYTSASFDFGTPLFSGDARLGWITYLSVPWIYCQKCLLAGSGKFTQWPNLGYEPGDLRTR
ncbi:MAG: hypothetical protein U0903_22095 [Planctomycetales bacterium]